MRFLVFILLLSAAVGCTKNIPNTTVPDTPENREVVEFMESYRKAVERRDVGRILALTSESYLDGNGTPVGSDDIDLERLREALQDWREKVEDVRYEIKYRHVRFSRDKVYVQVQFTASFKVLDPAGESRWYTLVRDNQVVLARPNQEADESEYRILSGL